MLEGKMKRARMSRVRNHAGRTGKENKSGKQGAEGEKTRGNAGMGSEAGREKNGSVLI